MFLNQEFLETAGMLITYLKIIVSQIDFVDFFNSCVWNFSLQNHT